MVQPTPLHYVNGGDPLAVQCANCETYLGKERCTTTTHAGVKFFCKMEDGDRLEDSCYLQWAHRHPHLVIKRN